MAQQTVLPWPERLGGAHFRAVLAGDGPVQRQRGLVGPAAIAAVPASRSRVHNAPTRPARDFSLDASRLRCRPSASPQSSAPEAVVVVSPTKARSVVQWRRVRPALERTDGSRAGASIAGPDVFESYCRYWMPMRGTRFLPRPGRALDWGQESVRPRESEIQHTPAPAGTRGTPRNAEPRESKIATQPRPCSRSAHPIVARSQPQRKQRLDAWRPRGGISRITEGPRQRSFRAALVIWAATRSGERSRRCRAPTARRRKRLFPRRAPSRCRPRPRRPACRRSRTAGLAPRAPRE